MTTSSQASSTAKRGTCDVMRCLRRNYYMAHDNFYERRNHIRSLLAHGETIPTKAVHDLAKRFGCGKTAIYRDIAFCSGTETGYRDSAAATVQNNRASRLGVAGTFTTAEWRKLREKYNKRCAICGEQKPLGPDHIRPISKGGTNFITNIQPVCQPCNSRKGAKWKKK